MSELPIPPDSPMQPDFSLDNNHKPESLAESNPSEDMQQLFSFFAEGNNPESADTLEEIFFNSDTDEFLTTDQPNLVETLKTTITELEKALAGSQAQLKAQIQHSQSADTLIAQQTEELNETQQHIAYLVDTLESTQEEAQRQQLQIETLTEQLIAAQEQTAHLERECALLKEECQEKIQKLFTAEKHIRELISRLQRQQRYTLQYKSALERYLESPTIQAENNPLSPVNSPTLSPQITPIKPWSSSQDVALSPLHQAVNSLDSETEKNDPPLPAISELELTGKQIDISEVETPLVSEDLVVSKADSLPEEIGESELISPLENPQPIAQEIKKPSFPPLLISGKRKSQGIVDLPAFLRNRS